VSGGSRREMGKGAKSGVTWHSKFRGGHRKPQGASKTECGGTGVSWEVEMRGERRELGSRSPGGCQTRRFAYDVAATRRGGDPITSCVTWRLVRDETKGEAGSSDLALVNEKGVGSGSPVCSRQSVWRRRGRRGPIGEGMGPRGGMTGEWSWPRAWRRRVASSWPRGLAPGGRGRRGGGEDEGGVFLQNPGPLNLAAPCATWPSW
jgi:hypothetical protein